jgi:hypothetical protein
VEEEIRRKDGVARANALGKSLKKTNQRRQVPISSTDWNKLNRELMWWRVRGALFVSSFLLVLVVDMSVSSASLVSLLGLHPYGNTVAGALSPPIPTVYLAVYFLFITSSYLSTDWDPMFYYFIKAKMQGKEVRLQDNSTYMVCSASGIRSHPYAVFSAFRKWCGFRGSPELYC